MIGVEEEQNKDYLKEQLRMTEEHGKMWITKGPTVLAGNRPDRPVVARLTRLTRYKIK